VTGSALTTAAAQGHWLLGILPDYQRDPLETMVRIARQGDLVSMRTALRPGFLLAHPDHVRRVLVDNAKAYSKNTRSYQALVDVLGTGLLTADGEDWKWRRKAAQQAFRKDCMRAFLPIFLGATEDLCAAWAPLADGRPVDVTPHLTQLTLTALGRCLFGRDLGTEAESVGRILGEALREGEGRWTRVTAPPLWLPTPANLRFRGAKSRLDATIDVVLRQRRGQKATGEQDFVGLLLDADERYHGDAAFLRDDVLTMIMAGHETISNALCWTLYLLAKHPDVQERLHGALADDASPYLDAVIDESLRLFPPVWIFTRLAEEDDVLGGTPIPKGSVMVICPYVIHRRPDLWRDADTFDPDRFLADGEASRQPRCAHMPFGAGPRMCIGAGFSLLEARAAITVLCRKYRFGLASDGVRAAPVFMSLRPEGGPVLTLSRRPEG
jgi:cytochrome P450